MQITELKGHYQGPPQPHFIDGGKTETSESLSTGKDVTACWWQTEIGKSETTSVLQLHFTPLSFLSFSCSSGKLSSILFASSGGSHFWPWYLPLPLSFSPHSCVSSVRCHLNYNSQLFPVSHQSLSIYGITV